MVMITVRLPPEMIEFLQRLVERGIFPSRSEAIRAAIRLLWKLYVDLVFEGAKADEISFDTLAERLHKIIERSADEIVNSRRGNILI